MPTIKLTVGCMMVAVTLSVTAGYSYSSGRSLRPPRYGRQHRRRPDCLCGNSYKSQASIEDEIRSVLKEQSDLLRAGDYVAASNLWAKDAILIIDGLPNLNGRDEIRAQLKKFVDDGLFTSPTIERFEGNCDEQVVIGTCYLMKKNEDGTASIAEILRLMISFKFNTYSNKWLLSLELNNIRPDM